MMRDVDLDAVRRDHIWQRGVWRAPWTDPHGHNQIVAIDSAGRLRGVLPLVSH